MTRVQSSPGTRSRRRFLTGGLAGGAGLSLAAPAVARDSQVVFSMITDRSAEATRLARRLSAVTAGRLRIDIRPSESVTAAETLSQVGSAEVDLCLTDGDTLVAADPRLGLFASMPMGMTGAEIDGWRIAGQGQASWDRVGEIHGIKPFAAGDSGSQALWSVEPLESLQTLSAGRVGSAGLGVSGFQVMGLDAVEIPKEAEIDDQVIALDGVSLPAMVASGRIERFPHMIPLNANRPSSVACLAMNQLLWLALPDADRLLLERVIEAHHADLSLEAMYASATARKALDGRITPGPMPEDIWRAQGKAANAILGSLAKEDPAVVDSYVYFLGDISRWSQIGEASFLAGRRAAMGGQE